MPIPFEQTSPYNLLDAAATRRLFGGNRPISTATLYRAIAKKIIPPPVKIRGSSRWVRSECEAALAAMIAGRNGAEAA